MTVLDRVREFLIRIAPRASCDDCTADQLDLTPRQHANHKTRELEKSLQFIRRVDLCSFCDSKTKKVIKYSNRI